MIHTKYGIFLLQKSVGNPNNVLVTCGNETDPRLQLGVDVADALTLVFMSDGSKQKRGVNITVFEINGTAATVRKNMRLIIEYLPTVLFSCITQALPEKEDLTFLHHQDQKGDKVTVVYVEHQEV